jgi:hypothetical protein
MLFFLGISLGVIPRVIPVFHNRRKFSRSRRFYPVLIPRYPRNYPPLKQPKTGPKNPGGRGEKRSGKVESGRVDEKLERGSLAKKPSRKA